VIQRVMNKMIRTARTHPAATPAIAAVESLFDCEALPVPVEGDPNDVVLAPLSVCESEGLGVALLDGEALALGTVAE